MKGGAGNPMTTSRTTDITFDLTGLETARRPAKSTADGPGLPGYAPPCLYCEGYQAEIAIGVAEVEARPQTIVTDEEDEV